MSWRYSTSYGSRDNSTSRDSSLNRYGLSRPTGGVATGEHPNRWLSSVSDNQRFSRNSAEPVEHSPVWAKTNVGDNSAAVQRLKERYNVTEAPKKDLKTYKRAETKDLSSYSTPRAYGRTLTSLSLGNDADGNLTESKFRRKSVKKSEPESPGLRPLDGRQVLYMPTATAKLLTRKYSNDLSPTTTNAVFKSSKKMEKPDDDKDVITVVTRGTSPTPTAPSIYLRSKRADFGLEKIVAKPREKPQTANKEVQTGREELSLSKYSGYSDVHSKSKPRTSYSDKYSSGSSYGSRLPSRCHYSGDTKRDQWQSSLGLPDTRRSTSREDSDDVGTPDSPQKTLNWRPPMVAKTPPTSPVINSEKIGFGGRSPPALPNVKSSLKLDCTKTESIKNPNSPSHLGSPLQCKMIKAESLQSPTKTPVQSPKVTIDRCPDVRQTIEDVSSMSESSEEETTSEEEEPQPAAMTVKKSVTNFLQNLPNPLQQNQSKANVFQKINGLSPQKINFKRIESGEKAWWMESSDKIHDEVPKATSPRSPGKDDQETRSPNQSHFLSPPFSINRQYSRDKDWLKGSSENLTETIKNGSLNENPAVFQSEANGYGGVKFLANGDSREINLDVNSALRRREFSKSPDNFLSEETNQQMKFNQQFGEPLKGEKNFLSEFSREFSLKDVSQKLQNGLGSPLSDKNFLEPGDMSGLISKAKAGLSKSKTKSDIKKSSSREMSPKVTDNKSEIDLYWKELADSLSRPLHLCDLDFTDLNTDDESDVLGNSKANGEVPPPPPMLVLPSPATAKIPGAPAFGLPCDAGHQPRGSRAPAPPPAPQIVKNKKTVKLFWKEVKDEPVIRQRIPDGTTLIWDELFKVKVDTQKLEYLFESRAKDLVSKKQQDQNKNKEIIVLDPKRSNAINIGMTKLPPPRAIKTAILKMDSTVVNKEGIEKILTMLPTEEEKLRIQEAQSTNPDIPLGSAEQFLLTLTSISELEARLKLWAFKLDFENSEKEICEPLMDLKQGMEILKGNKTFRGILSTLLSVGNFLNGYDVKGFQIEYLSKVPEVKDTVHKHSLLHHLCIIVMDKFPDSTDLYSEIGAVTRASKVDFDELAANIKKVEEECKLSWNYLKMIAKHEGHTAMKVKMSDFLADCAERIIVLGTIHKRIINRFRKFAFWLGVPANRISTTRPNEVFKIISEFALEYRTTRDRVLAQIKKMNREKSRTRGYYYSDSRDTAPRKMNSKEAKDDARLKELLGNDLTSSEITANGSTWRRQRRDTKNLVLETNNDDEEILETLIKTANQVPSSRAALKERRRSRVYGRNYCK